MAPPNLKSPTTITGKTVCFKGAYTTTVFITNPSGSGKVMKVNSIYCSESGAGPSMFLSVGIKIGATTRYLAFNLELLQYTTQIITTKDTYFYLEEGMDLVGLGYEVNFVISYEEFS